MNRGARIAVGILVALVAYQLYGVVMTDGRAAFASIATGVLAWFLTGLARRRRSSPDR